jgi:hypothetical protein
MNRGINGTGIDLASYPSILAWRPAFQRAMAKADPDLELKLG